MLINNSNLKFNVTFKGREIGFAPFEEKKLSHILTEADEKILATKYRFLVFKPNPKKKITVNQDNPGVKVETRLPNVDALSKTFTDADKARIQAMMGVSKNEPDSPSVTADYESSKETFMFAEKEDMIIREDDLEGAVDKVENISMSEPKGRVHSIIGDGDTDNFDDNGDEEVEADNDKEDIIIPEDYIELQTLVKKLVSEKKISRIKLTSKKADLINHIKIELGI